MKKLILSAFILLAGLTTANAQTPISYSEVVQVEGATKDELYQRAKNWFVDTFRSANDVIQLDDKENGQIVGKGNFSYSQKVTWAAVANNTIRFTAAITIKDGRYKYEFSNFEHSMAVPGTPLNLGLITDAEPIRKGFPKKTIEKIYVEAVQEIADNVASLSVSLKSAMASPTQAQSNDW